MVLVNKISCVIKMALEPTPEAASTMDGQSRICNWVYNHLLNEAINLRTQFIQTGDSDNAKTVYTERGLRNLLPKIKKEKPFLNVVHSSPLKNTALRLSGVIQAHQKSKKGKRKGKTVGWPKFRSWQQSWFSLFYDEPN
ncbi:MAG: RNA-guided endonuclease TnpB family protein, partial [Candidatus Paceibacterales bacterium]